VALFLGAPLLAVGFIVMPNDRTVVPTASDEPHYLIVTQRLVLDHDLDLANDYAGTRYLDFYPEKLPDIHGIVVGNAIYSIRNLGLPLLAVMPSATSRSRARSPGRSLGSRRARRSSRSASAS